MWGGNNLQSKTATSKVKASAVKRDASADPQFYTSPDAVPGTYIVSFTDAAATAPAQNANANKTGPQTSATAVTVTTPPDPATETSVANDLVTQYGGQVAEVWGASTSFLATNMTDAQAIAMSHDSRVAFVCADALGLSASGSQTLTLTDPKDQWDLDRIDQRGPVSYGENPPTFNYGSTGQGVNVYVMDSGIYTGHKEFEGRADTVFIAYSGGKPADVFGHGTACASLVGGATTGVAKNVRLHSVKVAQDNGGGVYWSDAIRGLDWISQHAIKPAVLSCSIGSLGPSHGAYGAEKALHNLINTGVTCVVSAGNSGIDAVNCTFSKVDQAIVVGASDQNDTLSNWYYDNDPTLVYSNYGSLITVFAPGSNDYVASFPNAFPGPHAVKGDYTGFDGTSGATPIVAGIAAQYLQTHPNARHEEVKTWLTNSATLGAVKNLPAGSNTPNRLVFTNL